MMDVFILFSSLIVYSLKCINKKSHRLKSKLRSVLLQSVQLFAGYFLLAYNFWLYHIQNLLIHYFAWCFPRRCNKPWYVIFVSHFCEKYFNKLKCSMRECLECCMIKCWCFRHWLQAHWMACYWWLAQIESNRNEFR